MSLKESCPETDAQWRAKWDAETLAKAELIKDDPDRLSKAQDAAAKLVKEEREEANVMARVAGKKENVVKDPKEDNTPKKASYEVFQRI